MDLDAAKRPGRLTLATVLPSLGQRRAAVVVSVVAAAATIALLPIAARPGLPMQGFFVINQTALIFAYGLSAWTLFAQFRCERSLPLLLMAGGTLYTAAIVLLQLLSLPGIFSSGRVLGNGPETTLWLWTFWHLGPPLCALAYAVARHRRGVGTLLHSAKAAAATAAIAVAAAALAASIATIGLPWLPRQVSGDDYAALVWSGVGPAVQLLTLAALAVVWRNTRRERSVLELWIAVSLVLLVFDNFLTQVGAARMTVGWQAGRVEALISAFAILWTYLQELDASNARVEAATAEMVRTEAALRQAQKMEAIGRLTGGIAHDFNNLLMVASSGFDMIRRRPQDQARVVKTAEAGLQAVERGARLTRQLLTFARRQTLHPETVNLNASLIDFEPLARRAVGEAANLVVDLHPALHPAQIDRAEFEAAVLNLTVNARDALPANGGRIVIATRNARPDGSDKAYENEVLASGDYVVISVADNGSGMDDATRARALEPFFTTKEFGRGSGLGLSQVYGFARSSGGTVRIASAPGRGSTIEIWLPSAKSPTMAKPEINAASPLRHATAGETVLAVEDEPAVLAAVTESLSDLGYRVIPAHDAAAALDRLRDTERVDILFSDVVMPGGMNGVQLAVEADRVRPGIRVLLTSGYTSEALTNAHGVPHNLSILAKPYRHEELAARLKLALSA